MRTGNFSAKPFSLAVVAALVVLAAAALWFVQASPQKKRSATAKPTPAMPREIQIDLDRAVAYRNGQLMNAQGRYLNSIKASDGRFAWRAEVTGKAVSSDTQVFSPPALGQRNLYLCSAQGHLAAVRQQDGAVTFLYALSQPMAFQPALARGNVYAGTNNGMVICLKTGDKDADGWYAWGGGNAQHNKN